MSAASVALIDYKTVNLDSIRRALEGAGAAVTVVDSADGLGNETHIVLPGVGAFPHGMANLRARGLDAALRARGAAGTPLLGICLGMQLLASAGSEGGAETEGLGLIPGRVDRMTPAAGERLPHVGWNAVDWAAADCPLAEEVPSGKDFYFVHSYCFAPPDPAHVAATTPYCGGIASVVSDGKLVFGTQFHPEKSHKWGLRLLANFIAY